MQWTGSMAKRIFKFYIYVLFIFLCQLLCNANSLGSKLFRISIVNKFHISLSIDEQISYKFRKRGYQSCYILHSGVFKLFLRQKSKINNNNILS